MNVACARFLSICAPSIALQGQSHVQLNRPGRCGCAQEVVGGSDGRPKNGQGRHPDRRRLNNNILLRCEFDLKKARTPAQTLI
jgi:hypothetical protein